MTSESDRHKNWTDNIDLRIAKLHQEGFFLEAFYLYSTTIEFTLQQAILYQEDWIRKILLKNNIKFSSIDERKVRDKTLGELIKIFSKYCNNKNIINELNAFNSFRKRITHHLLDYQLDVLNSEAKDKRLSYNQLVLKLTKYSIDIIKKHIRQEQRESNRI